MPVAGAVHSIKTGHPIIGFITVAY